MKSIGAVVLLALAIAVAGWAQDLPKASDFAQGLSYLRVGRYREAAEALKLAVARNPKDAFAWAFLGNAQNKLGEYVEAEVSLRKALDLEPQWRGLNYDLGLSLYYQNKIEEALRHFRTAVEANPKSADANWMLGLTLLRKEEFAGARDHFRRAADISPERYRERARLLLERLAREEKPWRVFLSVGGGYDSNVITLGEKVALPGDISSKRSGFGRFTLGGSYDFRLTREDRLTLGYVFLSDIYDRVSRFDLLDHTAFTDYRHLFAPELVGSVRINNRFTQLGRSNFRNQFGIRPALAYRITDWAVAELGYSVAVNNYYFPAPKVRDRDGVAHTISLTPYFRIPGTQLTGRVGYFHVWNRADGADYDFDSNGLLVGVSHPLFWQVTGGVFYSRAFDRYEHRNSTTGFAFSRKDDVDTINVQLSRPILEWLRFNVRYDYTNNHSNTRVFNYRQDVIHAGFVVEF